MKEHLKTLIAFILYLYEELFLIPAKKLLKQIKKIVFYDKIIDFFAQNIYLNLLFILIVVGLAETSAITAGFFIVKGFVFIGVLFYLLKVILLIPVIDLFNRNKEELLKFKVIKVSYYYYLKFKRLEIWKKVKQIKKELKEKIKLLLFENNKGAKNGSEK